MNQSSAANKEMLHDELQSTRAASCDEVEEAPKEGTCKRVKRWIMEKLSFQIPTGIFHNNLNTFLSKYSIVANVILLMILIGILINGLTNFNGPVSLNQYQTWDVRFDTIEFDENRFDLNLFCTKKEIGDAGREHVWFECTL